jgi:hypothetical protein
MSTCTKSWLLRSLITLIVIAAGALSMTSSAIAQSPATSASKYAWDQAGPDLATVQGYTYKVYADNATTGTVLTATCTGSASPFTCTAPIGAFSQGTHSAVFTASNAAGESAKSAAVNFTFVVIPSVPANPRIQ